MINPTSYEEKWIRTFKDKAVFERVDYGLLEKMIYALSLVESLAVNQLNFVFKGGTSLIMILPKPYRFSIDVDIVTQANRDDLEAILDLVCEKSNFKRWELDEERSYQTGIPKAHYEFYFDSKFNNTANRILLDVLFEENFYPTLLAIPVEKSWLVINEPIIRINIPSVESLVGDKLTAFAPETTGILFGKNKEVEIIKQLFDLGNLFNEIKDFKIVREAYYPLVEKEITYRNLDIAMKEVIKDSIDACQILAKRQKNKTTDLYKFQEFEDGLRRFKNHIITSTFRIDEAIEAGAKVAYILAKIKCKDDSPLLKFNRRSMTLSDYVLDGEWNYLNKLRKLPNGALFYWHQAIKLLTK